MHTLSDTITRIRNGYRAGLHSVRVLNSKLIKNVLTVLQNDGFIDSFFAEPSEKGLTKHLSVVLRYKEDTPAIHKIKVHSKPSRRVYITLDKMKYMIERFGSRILSTNKGVINDTQAKKYGVGGEYLMEVY